MVIKASSRTQVSTLIAQLASNDALTRDAAISRLRVIGGRALGELQVLAARSTAPSQTRAAALKALEGIDDPRALETILEVMTDVDDNVAAAAAVSAGAFVRTAQGAEAVDRLTAIAVDVNRGASLRKAALAALGDLGALELQPLRTALLGDNSPEVSEWAANPNRTAADETAEWLLHAVQGELKDVPASYKSAIEGAGLAIPSTVLLKLIERISSASLGDAAPLQQRQQWTELRVLAHEALATRGSRLALYDLREMAEKAAAPLPANFLYALIRIGDVTALESIASGIACTKDPEWRTALISAFRDIAAREKVSRRHAVAKKIEKRWPDAAALVWPPATARSSRTSRTRPR